MANTNQDRERIVGLHRGDESRLMRASDVADFLSVSLAWVYKAAADGRLPCVRLGRVVRFERAAIEGLVDSDRTTVGQRARSGGAASGPTGCMDHGVECFYRRAT